MMDDQMARDRERTGGERGNETGQAAPVSVPGKRTLIEQLRFKSATATPGGGDETVAAQGTAGTPSAFPYQAEIERSFGMPLDAKAHADAGAQTAASSLGAQGFAYDGHVAFASPSPSLFVAAHEAAHTMQDTSAVHRFAGDAGNDAHEAHADAVATRVVRGESAADLLAGAGPGASGVRLFEDTPEREPSDDAKLPPPPDKSARFDNDTTLAGVGAGTKTVKQGQVGVDVTKVQQALIDLGYLLPKFGVDGIFEGETKAAVIKFQNDQGLTASGELDKDTLAKLNAIYDTRKPYIDAAKVDPAKPETRNLNAADKAAAIDAMVAKPGVGGMPATFVETTPDGAKYGDEMTARLTALIAGFHKRLYEDKKPLRADPAKNLFDWSVMEGPPKASKTVVDTLYASNYGGAAAFPAMTHAGGNLIDNWDDQESKQALLGPAQKKVQAQQGVEYLIEANCREVNDKHSAVPSNAKEKAILAPIIQSFIDTPDKIETLLNIDTGWGGMQQGGHVFLQRFNSQNPDKDKAKEENRVRMWGLFQTCIHEYIHTLAHPTYQAWAQSFYQKGDNTRYNTLIEGFCDFFTLNVRKAMTIDPATQAVIEGPFSNGNPQPPDTSGVYPSNAQAEQVVSIVGIKNAQAGYFGGKTKLMGAA
jgi:peptidoglycan hydrolase-like protein with peptidoglycan-binding domain